MKLLFLFCLLAQPPTTDSLDIKVERLHDSILSVDTHNDFAMALAFPQRRSTVTKGQVSFELMKKAAWTRLFLGLPGTGTMYPGGP